MSDSGRPLFFGREVEIDRLRCSLAAAVEDGPRVVVIRGEGGIGKTRLLEVLHESHAGRFATGRGTRPQSGPHQEMSSVLTMLLGARGARTALTSLTAWQADGNAQRMDAFRARQSEAFAHVTEQLVRRLEEEPTVVALDDVHWLHPATVSFVDFVAWQLAFRTANLPTLFVFTHRTMNPQSSVGRLMDSLERSERTTVIEPQPLSCHDQYRLVTSLGVERPSATYLGLIERNSGGNPLRVKAAVALLSSRGVPASVRADDARALGRVGRQPALLDPVTDWVDAIEPSSRAALSSVAALQEEFTVATLAGVADVPSSVAQAAVDAGVAAGLLGSDGRRCWFAHPLIQGALYERLGESEREAVHRRCIAFLRRTPRRGDPDVAIRIGSLLLQTTDAGRAARRRKCFRAAADAAYGAGAWSDACTFYEAAIAAETKRPPLEEAVGLRLAAAQAHYLNHDADAARRRLEEVIEDAPKLGDDELWSAAALLLVRVANITTVEALEAPVDVRPLQRFLDESKDPRLRSRASELLAEVLIVGGRIDDGLDAADQAVELAMEAGDEPAMTFAYVAQGLARLTALDLDGGRASFDRAIGLARRQGDLFLQSVSESRLGFGLAAAGLLDEADEIATRALATAVARLDYSTQSLAGTVGSLVALLRGEFARARVLASDADIAMRRSRYMAALQFLPPLQLLLELLQGDWPAAESVFDRWRDQAPSVQRRYEGLLSAYRGQASPAELDVKPPRRPLTQVRAGCLAIAGELLSRGEPDVDRTSRLAVLRDQLIELEVKGFLFAPNWPVSVTRVRAEVEVSLGELAAAAVTYTRAIDGLRTAGAAPELCRALVGLAQLHVRSGAALEDVRVLAAEAHAIAKRCGMPALEERAAALLRRSLGGVAATPAQGTWRVVMLTDVVGSTQVSVELGDAAYVRLISHHHELVRRCLVEHHGVEFGDAGDGLWSWFTSADDALACADALRDVLLLEPATNPALDVKVVLAAGEPLIHDDKPTGVLLNLAARIMGVACSGDVLANEGIARRVSDPTAFVSLGQFELRSIPGQTPIFRRVWTVPD